MLLMFLPTTRVSQDSHPSSGYRTDNGCELLTPEEEAINEKHKKGQTKNRNDKDCN